MVNEEEIKDNYKRFNLHNKRLELLEDKIKNFLSEDDSEFLLYRLNNLKKYLEEKKINKSSSKDLQRLYLTYPKLKEYEEDCLSIEWNVNNRKKLLDQMECEDSEYVIINSKDKKVLADLKYNKCAEISKLDKNELDYLKKSLNGNFIAEIDAFDLPLIMTIKEDLEYNELLNVEPSFSKEEVYLIRLEYIRAKMMDNNLSETNEYGRTIKKELPFIYDSVKQINIWDDFDSFTVGMQDDEYWKEYYKILILFGNNIEDIYNEIDIEKRPYLLDAYYELSITNSSDHIRTASSLINEEILKRKYMKK